jgi:radical SAM protein with 4Fe4S-binding SPASM domain
MTFDQIIDVVNQFHALCCARGYIAQINFTGGEPFIRSDFFSILEVISSHYPSIRFGILTNGTLLTSETVGRLAKLRPLFIQISIDGSESTHDFIRGTGSHARAIRGLGYLHLHGITSVVSFTAHPQNYRDFPQVVDASRRVGATCVWTDRLVPTGRAEHLQVMTPDQTREFFNIVHNEQFRRTQNEGNATKVEMKRSLQFLVAGGRPYRCPAGIRLLAVMPDGVVYPCRRLPIPIDNILATPLPIIRRNARQFLRNINPCPSCQHAATCSGGSRCLAYATSGSLTAPDPGCWLYCEQGDRQIVQL